MAAERNKPAVLEIAEPLMRGDPNASLIILVEGIYIVGGDI
jgi:hypothetical protein